MGKIQDILNGLVANGREVRTNHDILLKADHSAFRPLVRNMLTNSNDVVREICAEILGDRGSIKAVPYLIDALDDSSLNVKQDAYGAIEKLCLLEPGALLDLLDIDLNTMKNAKHKVTAWWQVNKRWYIARRFLSLH